MLLYAYATVEIVSLLVMLYFLSRAREGWQDESGFHEGEEEIRQSAPVDDDPARRS